MAKLIHTELEGAATPAELERMLMRAFVGVEDPGVQIVDFDPYPPAYVEDDRVALEAITVCCVCGRPVEPRTEREYEACESLGVHLGECWHALKGDLAGDLLERRAWL